jgi:hypothetical protein
MKTFWYRIEIIAGSESYCYFGCSSMTESEMGDALSQGRFVTLDELTYYDDEGTAHRWSEWDPNCVARISLNPKFVVSMIPLVDHPRKRQGDGEVSTLLKYPGNRRSDETDDTHP